MKRNISGYFKTLSLSGIVVALAVIGLVASSCGKEKGEEPQNTFKRTVRVQLTKGADTKTAVVEGEDRAQFVWTEGDDNNFYVYENGVEGTVEDVEFISSVRVTGTMSGTGNKVKLTPTMAVSVYATKEYLENSDVATKEFDLSETKFDVNGDEEVNNEDLNCLIDILLGR